MKLTNNFGEICVQPLGAMLHDCVFRLAGGREVRPLYDAPWRKDNGPEFDAQQPIIKSLGSEWPCVPFGRPPGDIDLPSEWGASDAQPWDDWAHGYSSNNHWRLVQLGEATLRATIDYPENTPIQRLERRVCLLDDRAGIELSLTIHARHLTTFPVGLHPILSMQGADPGTLQLQVAQNALAWSFPIDVEPGRNFFIPNQKAVPLSQLAACSGGTHDIRILPPEGQTEDLVLLTNTDGDVGLVNSVQDCITRVTWDVEQLPGCLLWVSNGGRDYYPWNSRVAALGIEPVASVFDLGLAHSMSQSMPLAKQGYRTAITVDPDTPFTCKYQILITPA